MLERDFRMLRETCLGEKRTQLSLVTNKDDWAQIGESIESKLQCGDDLGWTEVAPHGVHRDATGGGG